MRGQEIDLGEHATLCSTLVRLSGRIGLDRTARDISNGAPGPAFAISRTVEYGHIDEHGNTVIDKTEEPDNIFNPKGTRHDCWPTSIRHIIIQYVSPKPQPEPSLTLPVSRTEASAPDVALTAKQARRAERRAARQRIEVQRPTPRPRRLASAVRRLSGLTLSATSISAPRRSR